MGFGMRVCHAGAVIGVSIVMFFYVFRRVGSLFSHVSAAQKRHADKNPSRIAISGLASSYNHQIVHGGPYFVQSGPLDRTSCLLQQDGKGHMELVAIRTIKRGFYFVAKEWSENTLICKLSVGIVYQTLTRLRCR